MFFSWTQCDKSNNILQNNIIRNSRIAPHWHLNHGQLKCKPFYKDEWIKKVDKSVWVFKTFGNSTQELELSRHHFSTGKCNFFWLTFALTRQLWKHIGSKGVTTLGGGARVYRTSKSHIQLLILHHLATP